MARISPEKIDKWLRKKKINRIIEAVNDKDDSISNKAVEALNNYGGTEAVDDLIAALNSKNKKLQCAAAKGLGRLYATKAQSPLLNALKNGFAELQIEAAEALGLIKSAEAIPVLAEMLNNPVIKLQTTAATALTRIGEPASDFLISKLSKESPLNVRIHAAQILGQTGTTKAIDPLIALLSDIHDELAGAAEFALRKIGRPCLEKVHALLSNPDLAARACRIINEAGDLSSIPLLIKILSGNDLKAIAEAVQALGNKGDSKTAETLIPVLSDARFNEIKVSKEDKKSDAELAEINAENLVKRMIRKNAIVALGKLGAEKATDQIVNALKNPHTRDVAIDTIIKIGETAITKALGKDEWIANDLLNVLRRDNSAEAKFLVSMINGWKENV